MKKTTAKRSLKLKRETLRTLNSQVLARVGGGLLNYTITSNNQSSNTEPTHNGIGDCALPNVK